MPRIVYFDKLLKTTSSKLSRSPRDAQILQIPVFCIYARCLVGCWKSIYLWHEEVILQRGASRSHYRVGLLGIEHWKRGLLNVQRDKNQYRRKTRNTHWFKWSKNDFPSGFDIFSSRALREWKRVRRAITRPVHLTVPFEVMQPAEYIWWESCIAMNYLQQPLPLLQRLWRYERFIGQW